MIFFFIKNLKHFISYYLSKIRGNWLYFLYYYNLQIWLSKILSEVKVKVLITQSCPTLWYTMNCSFPGSSVHGRILKWVAIPFSRGFSRPRDQIQVSWITGRFFTIWAPGGAQIITERPILKYVWKTMAYKKKKNHVPLKQDFSESLRQYCVSLLWIFWKKAT